MRVLVVDDDESNRALVCRYLASPSIQLDIAADGRAAVERAMASAPDVILLDLEMPVMDGRDAALRIRAGERATGRRASVIIGFSAHTDEAARRDALAAGCDRYLAKPVSRAVLLRTLQDAVTSPSAAPASANAAPDAGPADPITIDPGLGDVLADFLRSRSGALDELDAVLVADDRGALRRLAHRLAGSFGLYGFRWAAGHCQRVERDAEHAERTQLAHMLAALRRHLETVEVRCEGRPAVTKGDPGDGGAHATAGGG